jgi:hypothetical protein
MVVDYPRRARAEPPGVSGRLVLGIASGMVIGVGTLVLILIILLVIFLARRV